MREDALRKLSAALESGKLTECQSKKIYDRNFDEFFSKPALTEFERQGVLFMGDEIKFKNGPKKLPTPTPGDVMKRMEQSTRKDCEISCLDSEEKETLRTFLFSEPNCTIT